MGGMSYILFTPGNRKAVIGFKNVVVGGHLTDLKIWQTARSGSNEPKE
jgi:hypothetical protein